jgi:hypothetical protein
MRPFPFAQLVPTAAIVVAACANAATAPNGGAPARAVSAATWRGDTLWLPLGATAALDGGAAVTFVARGDDSRCPIDALCAWEGDAEVAVRVTAPGASGERRLHTSGRLAADTVTAGPTRLRLFGLLPARRASEPPPADAEVVALFVAVRR